MNMQYCINLATPVSPNQSIITRISPTITNRQVNRHFVISPADRDQEVVKWLDSLELSVKHTELFFTAANGGRPIHTDGPIPDNDLVKINWIYGGANSTMRWYRQREGTAPHIKETVIGTKVVAHDPSTVDLVYEAHVKRCALIQVGIPHSVYNPDEERWCISYLIGYKSTGMKIPWDIAVSRLSSFIDTQS